MFCHVLSISFREKIFRFPPTAYSRYESDTSCRPVQIVTANRSAILAAKAALHIIGNPIPLDRITGFLNVLKQERNHRPVRPVLKRVPENFERPKPEGAPIRGGDLIWPRNIPRIFVRRFVSGGTRVATHESDPGLQIRGHLRAQMRGQRLDHFLEISLIIRIQVVAVSEPGEIGRLRKERHVVGHPQWHRAADWPADRRNLNSKLLVLVLGELQGCIQRRPVEVGPGRFNC